MGLVTEEETLYLGPTQRKAFRFLQSRSVHPSEWPTTAEIAQELGVSSSRVSQVISSLRSYDAITIESRVEERDGKRQTRFGLEPESMEVLVKPSEADTSRRDPNIAFSALYLSEPAFGSKAFDDQNTMRGLSLLLDVNGMADDIQEVIIQGGIIPHLPPHYSKGYANDLKFLGKVKRAGTKSAAEKFLEDRIETEFERAFYERYVNDAERKKITTLSDGFRAAEEQITTLMSTLADDVVLRIQLGEEDRKNMEHLEVVQIKNWADAKARQIAEYKDQVSVSANDLLAEYSGLLVQKQAIEGVLSGTLSKKEKESKNTYRQRIEPFLASGEQSHISETVQTWQNIVAGTGKKLTAKLSKHDDLIKYLYWTQSRNDEAGLRNHLQEAEMRLADIDSQRLDLEATLADLSSAESWTNQLMKGSRRGVTGFTSQYPVFADELELGFKKVKEQYVANFHAWKVSQPLIIHVSPRKRVALNTNVKGVLDGNALDASVEYSVEQFDKKKVMLIHNIRHIFSDGVSASGIKDAKLHMNYENMVLKKFFDNEIPSIQPDIVLLSAHQTGGFRVMPWFKDTEDLIKGEFVKGQEIAYLVNLPTLQNVRQLDWLVRHNFRNWHTKRFLSGSYGAAAVVHTEDREGVNRFVVADTAILEQVGKVAAEIDVYRERLLAPDVTAEEKKELRTLIKSKKNEVKADWRKIEAMGDIHLGAPDHVDRISKYPLLEASQSYQRRHGLPHIASYDEILHGSESRIFDSASRMLGMTSEKFKQHIVQKVYARDDLTPEQKLEEITRASLTNMRSMTYHMISDQKHLFKILMRPYLTDVIEAGGQVIIVSGNHHNKSIKAADEALELGNQFPEEYVDSRRLHEFTGKGNDVGVGTLRLEGGQKLFVMHKFPERQDEIYGIMGNLRKANNDCDIAIGGDRHQPGAGYADGHVVVLHPGYEPINDYVPLIGKPAGVRGFNNIHYNTKYRGFYMVDFVINPTLEKIIEQEKIL